MVVLTNCYSSAFAWQVPDNLLKLLSKGTLVLLDPLSSAAAAAAGYQQQEHHHHHQQQQQLHACVW
jgi:hypothetical protein